MPKIKNDPRAIAEDILGRFDKPLTHDRSKYRLDHIQDFILFDILIVNAKNEKIWRGSINATCEEKELKKLAKILNQQLLIMFSPDYEKTYLAVNNIILEVGRTGDVKINYPYVELYGRKQGVLVKL